MTANIWLALAFAGLFAAAALLLQPPPKWGITITGFDPDGDVIAGMDYNTEFLTGGFKSEQECWEASQWFAEQDRKRRIKVLSIRCEPE